MPSKIVATDTAPAARVPMPRIANDAAEPAPAPVPVAAKATPAPAATPVMNESGGNNDALLLGLGGGVLLLAGLAGTAIVMRRRRRDETEDAVMPEEAIFARDEDVPAYAPVETRPVTAQAPVPATPMATTVPATTLDAMIAEAPSEANPFLTHAKRKRRAMALLQERAQEQVSAGIETPAAAPHAASADRSQTVYSFGKSSASPGFLKPRTR